MESTIVPLMDGENNIRRYVAVLTDITEQKLTEEALARSVAEIKELKARLRAENDFVHAEMQTAHHHGEIIGRSAGIKRVSPGRAGGPGGLCGADLGRNRHGKGINRPANPSIKRTQRQSDGAGKLRGVAIGAG